MLSSEIVFSPATARDAEEWYQGPPETSFRGYAARCEGELVGIGGVFYLGGKPVAFSEIRGALRKNRKALAIGCRMLMELVEKTKGPVYAIANADEPTAAYLLIKLGWRPTGAFGPFGETLIRS
jgi:hypothetical protein